MYVPDCVCLAACRIYTDIKSGMAQLEHPLIEYYRGAVFMDKVGPARTLLYVILMCDPACSMCVLMYTAEI